jgi:hypothetical protein
MPTMNLRSLRIPVLLAAALTCAAAFAGCAGDGATGDKGLVRFSLIVDYPETSGLEDPVAAGSTLLVALEHPGAAIVTDPPTFTELTLVTQTQSGDDPFVYPLGVAQYGVYFPGEGTYTLVAQRNGQDLDTVKVVAVKPDQLDFASDISITAADGGCTSSRTGHPDSLDLARNEIADLSVVPRAAGKALIGLLQLTASVTDGAKVDAPLVMPGGQAHQLLVENDGGSHATLTVKDEVHALTKTLSLQLRSELASVTCH